MKNNSTKEELSGVQFLVLIDQNQNLHQALLPMGGRRERLLTYGSRISMYNIGMLQ
jgi:hypothetical protein